MREWFFFQPPTYINVSPGLDSRADIINEKSKLDQAD